jgi:hypothetical protein
MALKHNLLVKDEQIMPNSFNPLPVLTQQEVKRFWSYVNQRGPDECWPWTRATDRDGYGCITIQGRSIRANRLALYLHTGTDPLAFQALHSCDNPPCCNPRHLKAGTNRENIDDMICKGRMLIGERNHATKLTETKVQLIRILHSEGISVSCLARNFSVDRKTLRDAVLRHTWKHVQ